MNAITPEGTDSTASDTTVGDEPTETGHGPEELDDVTDDGTRGDGTFTDGALENGEILDTFDAIEDAGGTGVEPVDGIPLDMPTADDDSLVPRSSDDQDGGEQLPDELMSDAMGRPLAGPDDDQGMENAGANLGEY